MESISSAKTRVAASEGCVADRGHCVVGGACKFGDRDVGDLVARVAVESARHADDVSDGWLGTVIAPVEGHGAASTISASCGQSTVDVGMNRGDGEEEGEERGDEPRGGVRVSHRTKVVPHRRQKINRRSGSGVSSAVVSGTGGGFGGRDILSERVSRLTLRRKSLLLAGEAPG